RQVFPEDHVGAGRLDAGQHAAVFAQVGEDADAVQDGGQRALVDDRVHAAVDQQAAGVGRQAVADEDDVVLAPALFQGLADAFGAAADVVDGGQVGMFFQ